MKRKTGPSVVKSSSKTASKKSKAKPSPKKAKGAAKKKHESSSFNDKDVLSAPNTKVMVMDAIAGLKEKNGSSVRSIKKFIAAAYKVDTEEMLPDIKKNISAGIKSGSILQPNGGGLGGTFILADSAAGKKVLKSIPAEASKPKKKLPATKKSPAKKKSPAAKKSPAKKKSPAPKKEKKTPEIKTSTTLQMVIDAIVALKEKNGSSAKAITKFIEYAHGKEAEVSLNDINQCLEEAVLSGVLIQPKINTYSLAESTTNLNKSESPATKKSTPKKKVAAKKSPAKKKTPKKAASKSSKVKKTPTKKKPAKSK